MLKTMKVKFRKHKVKFGVAIKEKLQLSDLYATKKKTRCATTSHKVSKFYKMEDVDELDPESNVEMLRYSTDIDDEEFHPNIPPFMTSPPPIKDSLHTETNAKQDEVTQDCLPLLKCSGKKINELDASSTPILLRGKHVSYFKANLEKRKSIIYDAARIWFFYWDLLGLSLLGENIETYHERVIESLRPSQNYSGGFGGGPGQVSHLAPTYAAVLSLAMVGGSSSLGIIDRNALWRWLAQLKQPDGGFRMCIGGEEDIRGAYIAMTIVSLLGLSTEIPDGETSRLCDLKSLTDGLPEYIGRCQTYEGGISGKPQTEAHGAYVFCALACLCLLGPPYQMVPRYLDLQLLISWLSARQYAPEGGYSGRTNKLVDGCYSHWVAGSWSLIEAALNEPLSPPGSERPYPCLSSIEGLNRYIMSCCQVSSGGFRDKPGVLPDVYHSCYVMAGLSATLHYNRLESINSMDPKRSRSTTGWMHGSRSSANEGPIQELHHAEGQVKPVHPIYVIPWSAAERCLQFTGQI